MKRVLFVVLVTAATAFGQQSKSGGSKSTQAGAAAASKKVEASSSAEFKPSELAKLAVIVTTGGNHPGSLAGQNFTDSQRLVEDAFLECLLAKGFTIAARSDVDSVLREKKFQESGATEELAASVGKVLNVPAVLLVRLNNLSSDQRQAGAGTTRASLGARLVSVETGAILWTGNHTDGGQTVGRSAAGAVTLATAVALAEAFPVKGGSTGTQSQSSDQKNQPKLAVITVAGSRRPARTGSKGESDQTDHERQVEDVFLQVLIQKGYQLVSRTDVKALAKEQAFQKSGLTEDNAVAAGKLLNVPAVLIIGVTESATDTVSGAGSGGKTSKPTTIARAAVGARLVDVATGEVRLAHSEYKSRALAGKGDAFELLSEVAKDVAQFMPPDSDSPDRLLHRGKLLESLGQVTAAKKAYRELVDRYAESTEGRRAAARLKVLGN